MANEKEQKRKDGRARRVRLKRLLYSAESTDELADKLADMLGIYGGCDSDNGKGCRADECDCRVGFVMKMKEVIRNAALSSTSYKFIEDDGEIIAGVYLNGQRVHGVPGIESPAYAKIEDLIGKEFKIIKE